MKKISFLIVLMVFTMSSVLLSQIWQPGTGIMYVNPSSANVGIGTTSPECKLHIDNGALKIGNGTDATSRTNNFLKIGNGDYVKIGEWEADDKLCFYANQGFSFNGGANKNIYFNSSTLRMNSGTYFYMGSNANGNNNFLRFEHWNNLHAYIGYGENLYFRPNNTSESCALVLQGDGKVAIGVMTSYAAGYRYQNQGYQLMVNGGILCEEVKIITDVPNSDYVFNTDYKLKPLSEVEKFVKENKHLPEIPSAEQFKNDGYKIGQMDDMLLRKVEELTLYLIDQNKRIEALENENKELRAKLNLTF